MENPLIGQRVLIRTYSAGVHIGTLVTGHVPTDWGRPRGL